MVLKDMFCASCGLIREDMVDAEKDTASLDCEECGRPTVHKSMCNGGTKVITWGTDGVDVNDYIHTAQVKAGIPNSEDIGTERESATAAPLRDKDNNVIHERADFLNDGLKAKREKREWQRQRNRVGHRVQVG